MKKVNFKKVLIVLIPIIIILVAVLVLVFKKESNIESNIKGKDNELKEEKKLKIVDVNSKTRPISVMVNNHKAAQPLQSGLNDAYLVYEIVTEGGISRMLAVFKDKDTAQIGTIRSSRHYFLDYVQENDAIYVHFGWSPQAEEAIKNLKINNINGIADNFYWRDKTVSVASEHTAYSSMEKIKKVIEKKKYATTTDKELLLNYSIEEVDLSKIEGAKKADNIKISYSNYQKNEFKYDSNKKVYVKYSNGQERKDRLTNESFTTKNIITYKVKNSSMDDYGRQDLDNTGNGDGYYISNGYAVPIKWEKKNASSQTKYTYLDGKEIIVNDGNTYIQIQPTNQNFEILENTN